MYPPDLYPGPTIQSRSAACRPGGIGPSDDVVDEDVGGDDDDGEGFRDYDDDDGDDDDDDGDDDDANDQDDDADDDDDDADGVQGVDVLHLESVRCRLQAVSQRQTCTLPLLQMKKRKENRDRSF